MSATTPRDGSIDGGFSVVELGIAMMLTALVSALMIVWIIGVAGADERQRSNDQALENLRDVTDQLSRDIRSAEYLITAQEGSMSMWLDTNQDDVIDPGETVTWTLGSTDVLRTSDTGTISVVATRIASTLSRFTYDSLVAADVAQVSIELVVESPWGASSDALRVSTDVYLRNS